MEEMIKGIVGVVTGVVLTEAFNLIRRKQQLKEQFFLVNYELRQNAYTKIYSKLIEFEKYFIPFMNSGNEFLPIENVASFAPLEAMNELNNVFNECELWLDKDTCKNVKGIIEASMLGCNLAIYQCMDEDGIGDNKFGEETVKNMCKDILTHVNITKSHIVNKCAMPQVDKYILKVNKHKGIE